MTAEEVWKVLDDYYARYPFLLAGPVPMEEVKKAEGELGVQFDGGYVGFILRYGGGVVGSERVVGLRHAEELGEGRSTVVELTRSYDGQSWVRPWCRYFVCEDGGGNPIGLDAEGRVILVDHSSGERQVVSASFIGFLAQLLSSRAAG